MKDRDAPQQSEAEVDRLAKALLAEHDRRDAVRFAERFVGYAARDHDLPRELLWRSVIDVLKSGGARGRA